MKIGMLGTGPVGQALAGKLVSLGHQVKMGSRQAGGAAAAEFVQQAGEGASEGTFADAAAFGDVIFIAAKGEVVLSVIDQAGPENLEGKVLVDISNPLDFSAGFPPFLTEGLNNVNSLGEAVRAAVPAARVVKTLNTVNAAIMVDPGQLSEPTAIFMSGDDDAAKKIVRGLLESFGWQQIIDLGGISTARGTEAWLLLWTRLMGPMGGADFNVRLVK